MLRAAMQYRYATRMETTPRSFIREILKVTEKPEMISFAGGLPNPDLFPVEELAEIARDVITGEGKKALQYSTTEGHPPLREWIAARYKKYYHMDVSPDDILITNGSQQSLDLVGKVFINQGSPVAIERPGYLGAIQAFSLYEPRFYAVPLGAAGPDIPTLTGIMKKQKPVFFYGIPNSQNPSGVTWSQESRREVAEIAADTQTIIVEDDAYGEIRFNGVHLPPLRSFLPDQVVMTGSFSKIIAPGLRMGWICAPREIREQFVTVKQGTDLHSNILSQHIIARFLSEFPVDVHIGRITETYHRQCTCMIQAIQDSFPRCVACNRPDGGMFLWAEMPEGYSSMKLFERAVARDVAILPGVPFYTDGGGLNSMRLNFSNQPEDRIREGIRRLGEELHLYLEDPDHGG